VVEQVMISLFVATAAGFVSSEVIRVCMVCHCWRKAVMVMNWLIQCHIIVVPWLRRMTTVDTGRTQCVIAGIIGCSNVTMILLWTATLIHRLNEGQLLLVYLIKLS